MTAGVNRGILFTQQGMIKLATGGEYCLMIVFPAGIFKYRMVTEVENKSGNEVTISLKINGRLIDTVFVLPAQKTTFETCIPRFSLKGNGESSVEYSSMLVTNEPDLQKTELSFSIYQEQVEETSNVDAFNSRQNAGYLKEIDFLRAEITNLRENLRMKEALVIDMDNAITARES